MLKLLAFQQEIVDDVMNNLKAGELHLSVVMPTGTGKTYVSAAIVKVLLAQAKKVAVLHDIKVLQLQTSDAYKQWGIDGVKLLMIQQVFKEPDLLTDVDAIILQETTSRYRRLLTSSGIDFSNKIVVSIFAIGQDLKE